jgi:GT2 family glycosyltransferase
LFLLFLSGLTIGTNGGPRVGESGPIPHSFSKDATAQPRIEIAAPVKPVAGGFDAADDEPWLLLRDHGLCSRKSRFVEISYSVDATEPPVRPLLRLCFGAAQTRDVLLPAPSDGHGLWFGKLPAGWSEIWISPSCRREVTSFRIEAVRALSFRDMAPRLLRSPRRTFYALAAQLVGLEDEAALNWRWALGREAGSDYSAWRARREPGSMSAPSIAPVFFDLFLDVGQATATDIESSCESIRAQSHDSWRVTLTGSTRDETVAQHVRALLREPRFRSDGVEATANAIVGKFCAGDVLAPTALAAFAACFNERRAPDLVYSDELRVDRAGRLERIWRPGWSPAFQRAVGYVGRAFFFRGALLDAEPHWRECAPEALFTQLAGRLQKERIGFIARPLFTVPAAPQARPRPVPAIYRASAPRVSIVIPTRDRPDLLQACLSSVFTRRRYQNYQLLLVDNGTEDARALELMDQMKREQPRFSVIRSPGPFNFSALCNAGAAAADGDYLVFLNNDTQIVSADWIERLLYFATEPDVGAVGAKLLFPNGRVQHAGVVLGMGGVAGHFGAGLEETDPGWLGRNLSPHEVSAVTAACLMIARRKFEAVGGFDAENLPVDLNDIDLCLRLLELGYRNICHSEVVLLHRQSASRGGGLRLQRVYARERRYFVARWRRLIRDDPYFNPGLSLYATSASLP